MNIVKPSTKEEVDAQVIFETKVIPFLNEFLKSPFKATVDVPKLNLHIYCHDEDELSRLNSLFRNSFLDYNRLNSYPFEGYKVARQFSKFCVVIKLDRFKDDFKINTEQQFNLF